MNITSSSGNKPILKSGNTLQQQPRINSPYVGSYLSSFPQDAGYGNIQGTPADHLDGAGPRMNAGGSTRGGAEGDTGGNLHSDKPYILLMGLKRSGKSSIQRVVFQKMSPQETLYLESTVKVVRDDVSDCSFIQFQVWDFPGHIDFFDPIFDFESIFSSTGAIIFVIDAMDDYSEALSRLHLTVSKAYKINSNLKFEVFIHKVDGLSDDQKIDTQRDIQQRANDDLADDGLDAVNLFFHLTTIYDHSIFESFSKVVQKLIPYMGAIENILNIFCTNSALEKTFLFDVASKIYIATDYAPVDIQNYELCCDMIDVVVDVTSLYSPGQHYHDPPFSEETASIIKLNKNMLLYLRGVNKFLALVSLLREESLPKMPIIEYNFSCVKKGLQEILELRQRISEQQQATLDSINLASVSTRASMIAAGEQESSTREPQLISLPHQSQQVQRSIRR